MTEQAIGGSAWFVSIPWGWLALISFAFWMGQDAYHSEGRIRKAWSIMRALGSFSDVKQAYEYIDLGPNYGGRQKYTKVFLVFEANKRIMIERAYITSKIYSFIGGKITTKKADYNWSQEIGQNLIAHESIDIPVAYIAEDWNTPGPYGDQRLDGRYLSSGSAHFITIRLITSRQEQKSKMQIFMPFRQPSHSPPDVFESGGRFLVTKDRKLPLPESEKIDGSR